MELENKSARELAEGLRSGAWTSVALTRHFLKRIAEQNPRVHAVPFVFEEAALAQAAASDQRRAQGEARGPLDGLPMTVKDSLRMKGVPSTYGLWPFRNHRPKEDSQLAKAMRDEGIVFLGRTAVPTGAFDWNTRNQVYAECVNPFDPARTPGGSSGGAAAALATGMTPLELGSDLGGSIRYPCHCCGVYGIRTTDGLWPIEDIGPEGVPPSFRNLVTFGPMANSLGDLQLLMDVFSRRLSLKPPVVPKAGKTIAYTQRLMGVTLEKESQSLFDAYLESLRKRGFTLEEVDFPVDPEELYEIWGLLAGYEYKNVIPKALRFRAILKPMAWWLGERRLGKGPFTHHFRAGLLASGPDYERALARREKCLTTIESFFARYDAWLVPVARGPAFPLARSGRPIESEGRVFSYAEYVGTFTVPPTAFGIPAVTLPIGRTAAGLPIGVQLFGPRFSDAWLIDFAEGLVAQH